MQLQKDLNQALPGWKFPIRQAPIGVLASATMPAVAIEIGNLNNDVSVKTLLDPEFQTKLAEQKNAFLIDWASIQKGTQDVDPLLQDGDMVRVDRFVPTVRVEGEVRRPGFVDYVPGRPLHEYIDLSGGFTERASKSSIRVSRSLTGQVLPARSVKSVQPGDFIWVPEHKDVDTWAIFRDVVAVVAQVAVIVYTLSR